MVCCPSPLHSQMELVQSERDRVWRQSATEPVVNFLLEHLLH